MISCLIYKEPSSNTLCKTKFEILYEIFKIHLIPQIIAPWVKFINVYTMT